MKWKKFEVHKRDDDGNIHAGPCIIEAPSPGVAVEYFLAIHGMLGYDNIFIKDGSGKIPDESFEDVLKLMPDAKEQAASLDSHHHWRRL